MFNIPARLKWYILHTTPASRDRLSRLSLVLSDDRDQPEPKEVPKGGNLNFGNSNSNGSGFVQ